MENARFRPLINLTLHPESLELGKQAASRAEMSFSAWVSQTIFKAAKRELEQPKREGVKTQTA